MSGRFDHVLRPSIRRRLFVMLFLPAAAVLMAGTVSDYLLALPPYTDAFDQELTDAALVVAAHDRFDRGGDVGTTGEIFRLHDLQANICVPIGRREATPRCEDRHIGVNRFRQLGTTRFCRRRGWGTGR